MTWDVRSPCQRVRVWEHACVRFLTSIPQCCINLYVCWFQLGGIYSFGGETLTFMCPLNMSKHICHRLRNCPLAQMLHLPSQICYYATFKCPIKWRSGPRPHPLLVAQVFLIAVMYGGCLEKLWQHMGSDVNHASLWDRVLPVWRRYLLTPPLPHIITQLPFLSQLKRKGTKQIKSLGLSLFSIERMMSQSAFSPDGKNT